MEKLILLRGATSVVEFDFSAFEFYDEGFCQFVMKRKINDDVICRLDFEERKKYYVTFKDEFTAGLDRDEYRFDIMLMLEDERYRQYYTSDIFVEDVVNKYVGVIDNNAIEIAEAVADDVEITQTIKVTSSNVIIVKSKMQEKNVIPNEVQQVVLPDSEFTGLSKVIVEGIPQDYVKANVENETLMLNRATVVEDGVIL